LHRKRAFRSEIAAAVLAQWLERAGHKMILLLPSAALSPELLAVLPRTPLPRSASHPCHPSHLCPFVGSVPGCTVNSPAIMAVAPWRSFTSPETLKARLGSARLRGVSVTIAAALQFAEERSRRSSDYIFARSEAGRPAPRAGSLG